MPEKTQSGSKLRLKSQHRRDPQSSRRSGSHRPAGRGLEQARAARTFQSWRIKINPILQRRGRNQAGHLGLRVNPEAKRRHYNFP